MNAQPIAYRLFAEPSFLEGISSVLDIHGELHKTYNTSKTGHEADKNSLQNDWRAVGDDLKSSISKYEQELAKSGE